MFVGGNNPYGDAEVKLQAFHFYNTAFSSEEVENLCLWGKYGTAAG